MKELVWLSTGDRYSQALPYLAGPLTSLLQEVHGRGTPSFGESGAYSADSGHLSVAT